MNPLFPACTVATLLAVLPEPAAPRTVLPSDPTGVFAVVDKVVWKPDEQKPTEVELHGAFCVAEGRHGNYYQAPRAGVLRFGCGSKPEEAVRQWRELQKFAGTGTVIAFSSRYEQAAEGVPRPTVVDVGAPAAALAPYGASFGLHKVEGLGQGPARELALLSRCGEVKSDAAAGHRFWPAKPFTFTCTNCAAKDQDLAYVFEVRTSDGDHFASGLVAPGAGTTSWTTELALEPGEAVEWSVRAVGSKVARAPCAVARFTAPAAAKGQ